MVEHMRADAWLKFLLGDGPLPVMGAIRRFKDPC